MDPITLLPAFARVGASFLGILVALPLRARARLLDTLFASILTLWTGAGLAGVAFQARMMASPENYLLLAVVLMLLFFTEALDKTGRMRRTIDALEAWLKSPRLLLAGFPALVGAAAHAGWRPVLRAARLQRWTRTTGSSLLTRWPSITGSGISGNTGGRCIRG